MHRVKPGFWREHTESDIIVECKVMPENCLGNDECKEMHTGLLCESCLIDQGFTRAPSYKCDKCGKPWINVILVVLVILTTAIAD